MFPRRIWTPPQDLGPVPYGQEEWSLNSERMEQVAVTRAAAHGGTSVTLIMDADTTVDHAPVDVIYLGTDFDASLCERLLLAMEDAGRGVRSLAVPGAAVWPLPTDWTERRFPRLAAGAARAQLGLDASPQEEGARLSAQWVLSRDCAFVRGLDASGHSPVEGVYLERALLLKLLRTLRDPA